MLSCAVLGLHILCIQKAHSLASALPHTNQLPADRHDRLNHPLPPTRNTTDSLTVSLIYPPHHHPHQQKAGYKVDLCSTGAALTLAARKIADEWTAKRLQQYTQYLEAGVIPVDATNIQLLGADKGMALFRKQQQQEWERRQPKEQQPQPVEAAAAVGQQESQQQTQQQA